ncbi:MAG TPA: ABC transporter substrate-binding protein [Casimicrobiaceae bacterium]|nr:ABC transporter substrate-binding protein [Casimicrobiaceae bacterium]
MKRLLQAALAALLLAIAASNATAKDLLKIHFTLDWKLQGIHAWYFWAREKGYLAKEGVDLVIDQGDGSAYTVTRIMSGTYDAGFGDVNAIIQNTAERPGIAPVMVYMIYSKAPFALLTKATSSIKTVADMRGKKLGAPAGSAALKLFPLLAERNGLPADGVTIQNMTPALQEPLLIRGDVDADAVFTATSYMNLVALHLDPDKDFRWLYYTDYGLDLYSNGVMVSQNLIREHPEAVKGLLRAIARSMREVLENPDAAMDMLAKSQPLINKDIEKRRLLYVARTLIDTPESRRIGVGDIDDHRMAAAIAAAVKAYDLPRTPSVSEVFNRAFLPPIDERRLPPIPK